MKMNGKRFALVLVAITGIIVGSMNTFLIATEDIGSWKNYIGYVFLAIALICIVILTTMMIKFRRK